MSSSRATSLRWTGIVVVVLGVAMAIAGGAMFTSGRSPALLAAGLLAVGGGGVALLRAGTPPPAAAPTASGPLGVRRKRWFAMGGAWLVSLAAATGVVWAMGPASPALPKLVLFLGLPTGTLLAGRRWLENTNGSADWPTE